MATGKLDGCSRGRRRSLDRMATAGRRPIHPEWQAFATKHQLALVACRLHRQAARRRSFIETTSTSRTAAARRCSMRRAARQAIASSRSSPAAPLLLWGMSAGGQFNYEFVAWKPERVIAFVVNKGGIYYSVCCRRRPRRARHPVHRQKDSEFRINTISGSSRSIVAGARSGRSPRSPASPMSWAGRATWRDVLRGRAAAAPRTRRARRSSRLPTSPASWVISRRIRPGRWTNRYAELSDRVAPHRSHRPRLGSDGD